MHCHLAAGLHTLHKGTQGMQRAGCLRCMPQNKYYAADAVAVDPLEQSISCVELEGRTFDVKYDVLAIATGSQGRLLVTPGCPPAAAAMPEQHPISSNEWGRHCIRHYIHAV
jgi:NADH dehydrogenase FAD-containing subunit